MVYKRVCTIKKNFPNAAAAFLLTFFCARDVLSSTSKRNAQFRLGTTFVAMEILENVHRNGRESRICWNYAVQWTNFKLNIWTNEKLKTQLMIWQQEMKIWISISISIRENQMKRNIDSICFILRKRLLGRTDTGRHLIFIYLTVCLFVYIEFFCSPLFLREKWLFNVFRIYLFFSVDSFNCRKSDGANIFVCVSLIWHISLCASANIQHLWSKKFNTKVAVVTTTNLSYEWEN